MGSFSVLNNISAITGQNLLNINNVNLNRTLNRMASGLRINTGADDAAGLQIADTLRANASALDQGVRNANDGLSFLQIADGALNEITLMLTRLVTLASEAANEPIDDRGRNALNLEAEEIIAEIARLANTANFNGTILFDHTSRNAAGGFGDDLGLFVGDLSGSSYIEVKIGYITTGTKASLSVPGGVMKDTVTAINGAAGANLSLIDLATSHATAAAALPIIRNALNQVAIMRGTIGAGMNRLHAAVSVMQTQARNTIAAESQIRDANMAEEITNLTKYQILAQTGIAALAHSNANSQLVLSLLR